MAHKIEPHKAVGHSIEGIQAASHEAIGYAGTEATNVAQAAVGGVVETVGHAVQATVGNAIFTGERIVKEGVKGTIDQAKKIGAAGISIGAKPLDAVVTSYEQGLSDMKSGNYVSGTYKWTLGPVFSGIWGGIRGIGSTAKATLWDTPLRTVSGAANIGFGAFGNLFTGIGRSLKSAILTPWHVVKHSWKGVTGAAGAIVHNSLKAIDDSVHTVIPHYNKPQSTGYAAHVPQNPTQEPGKGRADLKKWANPGS